MNIDFLIEAKKIGDIIINKALKEEEGWCWPVSGDESNITYSVSLYNGTSGVLIFLIDLYESTHEEKYLIAIREGARWLMNFPYEDKQDNLAFYCGIGGVVYCLTRLYTITNEDNYLEFAYNLVRNCRLDSEHSEILYGTSGTILTLLYFYSVTESDDVLDLIFNQVRDLLNNAIFPRSGGVCWDLTPQIVAPLCGFAHGVSGIAFIFLQLFKMFNHETFLKLADLAFIYEDKFYAEKPVNNWVDNRLDIYSDEKFDRFVAEYKSGIYSNIGRYSYMSAWCHGAPGIGMVRLLAHSLCNERNYYVKYKYALENTLDTINQQSLNYTLCHGILGNAHLMLDSYMLCNDIVSYEIANEYGKAAVQHFRTVGYFMSGISRLGLPADCDYFNGLSGIGHFFLRLSNPSKIPSLLLPLVPQPRRKPTMPKWFNNDFVLNIIYEKLFPNTSLQLKYNDLQYNKSEIIDEGYFQLFENLIKNRISNDELAIFLTNSYQLDLMRDELSCIVKNNNYFTIKHHVEKEEFNEYVRKMNRKCFPETKLVLNYTVRIIKQPTKGNGVYSYTLLAVSSDRQEIQQVAIGEFTYSILMSFVNEERVEVSLRMIRDKYANIERVDDIYNKELLNLMSLTWLVLAS